MTTRKSTVEQAQETKAAREAAEADKAAKAGEAAVQEALAAQGGPVWEVLTEAPNGHRTVHRVRALDEASAVQAVRDAEPGLEVLESAMMLAGRDGLGSNNITADEMMDRLKRPE